MPKIFVTIILLFSSFIIKAQCHCERSIIKEGDGKYYLISKKCNKLPIAEWVAKYATPAILDFYEEISSLNKRDCEKTVGRREEPNNGHGTTSYNVGRSEGYSNSSYNSDRSSNVKGGKSFGRRGD